MHLLTVSVVQEFVKKEVTPAQLLTWKERFVQHYTILVTNMKSEPFETRYNVYRLEVQNLESCIDYALEDLDLFERFQSAMMDFLEGVERKRWEKVFSSFCLRRVRDYRIKLTC